MMEALLPLHDDEQYTMTAEVTRVIRSSVFPPPFQQEMADASAEQERGNVRTLSMDPVARRVRPQFRYVLLAVGGALLLGIGFTALVLSPGSPEEKVFEPSGGPDGAVQKREAIAELGAKKRVEEKAVSTKPADGATGADASRKDEVRIELIGLVQGAVVKVNGDPVTSPFALPKSDVSVRLQVDARGYARFSKEFVPSEDRVIEIQMDKAETGQVQPPKTTLEPQGLNESEGKGKPDKKPKKKHPGWAENPFD
jgi:hypothetical protein